MEIEGAHPAGGGKLIPWVEKYRPDRVDDISHQEEVVKTLQTSIDQGNLPHLLFYGPPGTGKTTTVLALARALYGPTLFRSRILELNASDERGIKVVRDKIKLFAQSTVGDEKVSGYPCPRFKLIILDEADTMTPEAQSALRRIMENYSRVTRFCLICNYVTRVIEPLASRCAKFRFKSLPAESMTARLLYIAEQEQVQLADGALNSIMNASGGDMRKAVTYLQSSFQLSGGSGSGRASSSSDNMWVPTKVTPEMVTDISGQIPANAVDALWISMASGTFDKVRHTVHGLVADGFPMSALFSQLHDDVVSIPLHNHSPNNNPEAVTVRQKLTDLDKAVICEKIAAADLCLLDGASELLQLMDVAAFVTRRLSGCAAEVDIKKHTH